MTRQGGSKENHGCGGGDARARFVHDRHHVITAWCTRLQQHSCARARTATMGDFKQQGVYWSDSYVGGHPEREHIGPDKRLAETMLRKSGKSKGYITYGRF
jgi:hypothetical protein